MPDIDIDFDERRRGDVIRYVTEKWGEDKVAQIATFGTIKAKAAIKDSGPGASATRYALGDRISKAFPPAVMGKDIPLSGIFDPTAPALRARPASSARSTRTSPRSSRSSTPAAGLEGLIRQTGVHAGRGDHVRGADHRPHPGLRRGTPTARSSRSSTTRPARRSAC